MKPEAIKRIYDFDEQGRVMITSPTQENAKKGILVRSGRIT